MPKAASGSKRKKVVASNYPVATISPTTDQEETKPSLPLKAAFPKQSLGDSGTRTLHGIIQQDYNPDLRGVQGIKLFDEMRMSDGTCRAAMLACTLPIREAEWFVKPATDEQQDVDIADFVKKAMFEWLDLSWDDIMRQALLCIPLGVMLFEKVYGMKADGGKDYVTLVKLAPRLPQSVMQWELVDGTFGVQQIRQDGQLAQIPASKLLIFVNEREGDNWWGTSFLRAAYKHYYYKNNFYRLDAVAMERQSVGVPMIKMPAGYTKDDEAAATKAAANLRGNENAFILLPDGYEAEFMDMGANSTRDPEPSINHHNKEILMSVLLQFLELGQTKSNSGSHALSSDHSELFLKGIEAVANNIKDVFNKSLIKELVDLNFNDIEEYPTLDFSDISKADIQGLATAFSTLTSAGAIDPTDADQQYIRALLGLPERTEEEIEEAKAAKQQALEVEQNAALNPNNDNMDGADDNSDKKTQSKKKTKVAKPAATEASEYHFKHKFTAASGFTSWRPLTMAEENVSLDKIQAMMNLLEKNFTKEAKQILLDAKDSFMARLQVALKTGDAKAIAALEVQFKTEYKTAVYNAMRNAYEYGKANASREIEEAIPATDNDVLANFDLIAGTMAEKTITDIEAKAKIAAVTALKNGTPALQAAGEIDAKLEEVITKAVDTAAGIIVAQGVSAGRAGVFEDYRDEIYALERSEILDETTCNFCLSMDGLVIDMDDKFASFDIFHGNCRGIWVAILNDEVNPPEITGVPDKLAAYYGGQTNELIQPPRPIVREDSAAADLIEKMKK